MMAMNLKIITMDDEDDEDHWEYDLVEDYHKSSSKPEPSTYKSLFEDEIDDIIDDSDYEIWTGEYEDIYSYTAKATKCHSVTPDYEVVSVKKSTRPKMKKRPKPPEADRPQGVFVLRKNVSELVLRRLFAKVTPMVKPLALVPPLDDGCYSCAL
jgi:hypothetical protein